MQRWDLVSPAIIRTLSEGKVSHSVQKREKKDDRVEKFTWLSVQLLSVAIVALTMSKLRKAVENAETKNGWVWFGFASFEKGVKISEISD